MEIARMFGILPVTLKRLPLSEFRLMARYYKQVYDEMEKAGGSKNEPGPNDTVVE